MRTLDRVFIHSRAIIVIHNIDTVTHMSKSVYERLPLLLVQSWCEGSQFGLEGQGEGDAPHLYVRAKKSPSCCATPLMYHQTDATQQTHWHRPNRQAHNHWRGSLGAWNLHFEAGSVSMIPFCDGYQQLTKPMHSRFQLHRNIHWYRATGHGNFLRSSYRVYLISVYSNSMAWHERWALSSWYQQLK